MQSTRDKQTETLRDPFTNAFGYGRRICSGVYPTIVACCRDCDVARDFEYRQEERRVARSAATM